MLLRGYNSSSVFFQERVKILKNSFNLDVSFSKTPTMPYEWEKKVTLMHVKLERISTEDLKTLMTSEGTIKDRTGNILLSDTKSAIVLRLDKKGKILARSFLEFEKSLDVSEYACNLKASNLNFIPNGKKVKYSTHLSIEKEMKDYIINSIKKSKDEDLKKYMFYLYRGEIEDYSHESLLNTVESATIDKNLKLYKFLIES